MKHTSNFIKIRNFMIGLFGAFLFALSYRVFLVPSQLYSGSVTGIAQIIQDFLLYVLKLPIPQGLDLTGTIFWFLNIPLFLLAYRSLGHGFVYRTIVTVCFQSLCMTVLPVPAKPLLDDLLLNVIIGGAIAGFGIGVTLRYGSSGGGLDIVGMYFAKKSPDFSVGKVSNTVNLFIYLYCALTKNLEVAVYSCVFALISGFVMDKAHYQNIKICVFIISENETIGKALIRELTRGITTWTGYGEFTHQKRYIRMTVVSKYELQRVKRIVHSIDPNAFIKISTPLSVSGNFLQNLES